MEKNKELTEDIKIEKNWLHVKYIAGISVAISAVTIVASCYTNTKFVDQVSFASTITSIILSVIAIIMTIAGEIKSDNTKNKLEMVSNNLLETTEDIRFAAEKFQEIVESNGRKIIESNNQVNKVLENGLKRSENNLSDDNAEAAITTTDKKSISYKFLFNLISKTLIDTNRTMLLNLIYFMIVKMDRFGNKQISPDEYYRYFSKIGLPASEFCWGLGFAFSEPIFNNNNNNEFRKFINDLMTLEQENIKNKIDSTIKLYN